MYVVKFVSAILLIFAFGTLFYYAARLIGNQVFGNFYKVVYQALRIIVQFARKRFHSS